MSGKKYADSLKAFDRETFYAPTEAINILKSIAKAKFDETVEVAIRLGVDPR
ncbi:MAG: 50S ribosomal protein L1, partial [Actinomycetota bacterium]|nr:50S ribosomal protein L1 [Actinomycetota bacterium]